MHEYRYFLLYILFLLLCWVAWLYRWNIIHLRRHNYHDLVKEKKRLHQCVADWRYPDGTYVPQHKRQQMFRDMLKLSKKIRNHPDNPDNMN